MGTNYYLRKKVTLEEYLKTHLEDFNYGNTLDILFNGYVFNKTYYASERELNEVLYLELHIGKSSAGWHFGLCIYPELGINNLEDWKREFNNPDNEIIDEYWINPGDIISAEKMLDIIDVEEMITDAGYTKAVILPSKTSYVNLILKEVNGIMIEDRDKVIFSKASVFSYIACSAILSAIISLLIKNATMVLWNVVIDLPFLYRQPSNFVPLIIGAGLGAIYAFVMCVLYINGESSVRSHINSKRISKKSVRRTK